MTIPDKFIKGRFKLKSLFIATQESCMKKGEFYGVIYINDIRMNANDLNKETIIEWEKNPYPIRVWFNSQTYNLEVDGEWFYIKPINS